MTGAESDIYEYLVFILQQSNYCTYARQYIAQTKHQIIAPYTDIYTGIENLHNRRTQAAHGL